MGPRGPGSTFLGIHTTVHHPVMGKGSGQIILEKTGETDVQVPKSLSERQPERATRL